MSNAESASLQHTVKQRIVSEFRQMPGLCLTVPQASRLFGLAEQNCQSMLEELVEDRVIERFESRYRNFLKGTRDITPRHL